MQSKGMSYGSLGHGKLYAKIKGPKSKDEKVISLLSPFHDKQADIVADGG